MLLTPPVDFARIEVERQTIILHNKQCVAFTTSLNITSIYIRQKGDAFMKNRVKLILTLFSIAMLFGCGITRPQNDYSAPKATFLRVNPGYAIVGPGESVQFSAVELDGNGVEIPNSIVCTLKTQSEDAIMEPNGSFRATSVGEYQIEFRSSCTAHICTTAQRRMNTGF